MAKKASSSGERRRPARSSGSSKGKPSKTAADTKAKAAATEKKPARRASAAKAAGKTGKAKATAQKRPRLKKSPLSAKQLREFHETLLAKRRELLGDMSGMEAEATRQHGSGNFSSMPTHMADVGTDNFEHEFTLGLLESEQQLLREIDEAMQRIDEKTYGICLGTGEPIPPARLTAKPWAKYTVEYARLLEKGLVKPPEQFDAEGLEEAEGVEEESAQEQQPGAGQRAGPDEDENLNEDDQQ